MGRGKGQTGAVVGENNKTPENTNLFLDIKGILFVFVSVKSSFDLVFAAIVSATSHTHGLVAS